VRHSAFDRDDLVADRDAGAGRLGIGVNRGDDCAAGAREVDLKTGCAEIAGLDETIRLENIVAMIDGDSAGESRAHAGNKFAAPIDQRTEVNHFARRLRRIGRVLSDALQRDVLIRASAAQRQFQRRAARAEHGLRGNHSGRGLQGLALHRRDRVADRETGMRRGGIGIDRGDHAIVRAGRADRQSGISQLIRCDEAGLLKHVDALLRQRRGWSETDARQARAGFVREVDFDLRERWRCGEREQARRKRRENKNAKSFQRNLLNGSIVHYAALKSARSYPHGPRAIALRSWLGGGDGQKQIPPAKAGRLSSQRSARSG
jgi:hypothetical protein